MERYQVINRHCDYRKAAQGCDISAFKRILE